MRENKGYIALVGSALSFSLMTVCVKQLGGRIPVAQIIFTRALISVALTNWMINHKGISQWGNKKGLLLLRGLLGTTALVCVFKALMLLPLAIATIIQYTYPTFTALAAAIFLKEPLKKNIIFSVALGMLGVILVVNQDPTNQNTLSIPIFAIFIAILGAILTSLAYICVKELSKTEDELVIVYYFPFVSLPLTIPFLFFNAVLPSIVELAWLLGIGLFTQIGQLLITKGLYLLPAGKASTINYSQVIFASILGLLFFSETISMQLIIGALFVLLSIIINFSHKDNLSINQIKH